MSKNILMFFTDQLRFDAIAANGNPVIKTPNIDSLVKNGVTFTNAFTPSPVCVAARCSMHYGQYPTKTNCWNNGSMPVDERKSYVHLLTENGYRTEGIGKCHFTPDANALRGYQHRYYQEEFDNPDPKRDSYINYLVEQGITHAPEPMGVRSDMYYIPQPSRLPQDKHPTNWIGDRSIDFLNRQSNNVPWYLFSSFIHPHPPFSPPTPWHTLYNAADMPLPNVPENSEELQLFVNKLQNRYKYRDYGIDKNLVRMMKAYYYDCVSFIDYQVGRIIDTLKKNGQYENTVIIFAADHGELLGDYNCFGKRSMHNAASKIPLIICGGDFRGGTRCDTPVSLVDIAPTVCEIAGINPEGCDFDGIKLQDVLEGRTDRKGVYSFYGGQWETQCICGKDCLNSLKTDEEKLFACMDMMYAEKDFKYIYSAQDNKEILFDEKNDSKETVNCIDKDSCRNEAEYLRGKLITHLNDRGFTSTIDVKNNCFKQLIRPVINKDQNVGLLRQDFRPDWCDYNALDNYKK